MATNCPSCGGALAEGWKFCEHCGASVDAAMPDDGRCTALTKSGTRCRRRAMPGQLTCTLHAATEAAEVTAPLPAVGATPVRAVGATPAALSPGPPPGVPGASPEVPPFGTAPDRSSWRVAALAAAAAVVVLAILLAVLNSIGTHRRLDDTRHDLATTEQELATTKTELASRTAERDDLRNKLTAAEGELGGVKQSLSDTRSKVDVQAGQIDSLKTCLNGVLDALDSATAEEAFRILDSVESACERSSELL